MTVEQINRLDDIYDTSVITLAVEDRGIWTLVSTAEYGDWAVAPHGTIVQVLPTNPDPVIQAIATWMITGL